ncbi:MAG: hypothetical protein ACK481_00600 [Candidatus Melainabacteria bacterium]|jgi:hypothetical protein
MKFFKSLNYSKHFQYFQLKYIFGLFLIMGLLLSSLAIIHSQDSKAEVIKSEWEAEEDTSAPVSATFLEQMEVKAKQLADKQKYDEAEMARLKEEIRVKRKALVACMKQKDVTLFSVDDCAACKDQRAYFGEDFSELKYVDCKKNAFTCPFRGVKVYPTWYFGSKIGLKKEGVKDLPTLARLSGCEW